MRGASAPLFKDRQPDADRALRPVVSLLLMLVFLAGGSVVLVLRWPPGPAYLDWGVWILTYFGYLYVIGAALFYVRTGR